jgi:glucosylglycerate synthase
VPFHGVPGRGAALRLTFAIARRLGARGLVLLEADVTSASAEWVERLLRPVLDQKADLVLGAYARHRYEGTLTNLVLAPLVRALFGRRLHAPLAGAAGFSARLLDRLLADPGWPESGYHQTDLWVEGTASVDGFAVWEAWLGPRRAESRTRTADLPTMVTQAVGGLFGVMSRYDDLWLEVRGSELVPAAGVPVMPSVEPMALDVDRMVGAFRRGLRDLGALWEHILAPETRGDVLSLDTASPARFGFPDELWARVVYDFALGHHYNVVYRDHLLRSFVPLYLGRTAAFVVATRDRDVGAA